MGPLCLAACTSDADCRSEEGYVCDQHACSIPNLAAIVPRQCPGAEVHDKAFDDSELWGVGAQPSAVLNVAGFIAMFATTTGLAVAPDPADVKPFAANGRDAVLARDDKTLYAAWRDSEAIELASSSDGEAWTTPIPIQAEDGSELGHPMLAASKGVLFAMYGEGDHGLRVRTSHDGGKTFATTVTPLAGAYGNAIVDETGALHLVTLNGNEYGGYGSAQQRVEYATSRDGAAFTAPLVVSGRDERLPTYFANPSIAVDTRRKWLYVAYVRGGRDAMWEIVVAATRDDGKTWTRRTIGDGCAIHLVPNLALDPVSGALHLAYYDNAGSVGRFVHASCTTGAAACTPWGAINTQPFAALPLGRRTALFLGDRESLFVDAKRRVLHAMWTQPVIENNAIVSRVFHATAKLH